MTESALPDITLAPGLEIELTRREEELLQQLFPDYQYVLIEQEFEEGYGPGRVFRVTPWRAGQRRAAQVVKLGPLALIADEEDRHDRYVRDTLPLLAPPMTSFAQQDDLGAIAYIYLGGSILGETISLKDYYLQHSAAQTLAVLERLLVEGLGPGWYGQRQPDQGPLFFGQFYGPYFPADLTLTLDEISQTPLPPDPAYLHFHSSAPAWKYRRIEPGQMLQLDGFQVKKQKGEQIDLIQPDSTLRIRINLKPSQLKLPPLALGQAVWVYGQVTEGRRDELVAIVAAIFDDSTDVRLDPEADAINLAGRSYPNPLKIYQSYLDQPLSGNLSTIHGDLHLFNIIVDSDHRPWLIDFGRVRLGHAIFDFIELETHLRHAILSDAETSFSLADLADFERRLICAAVAPEPSLPPADADLAKAFAVIHGIRAFAADYLARRDDFQGEYFPALFLYTLATLKHYRENGVRSARHAFITATVLAAYLTGQLECLPEPSPPPPILTVTDPTLYLHAYYLKKASGDTPAQQAARQKTFIAQVQRAADVLRRFLSLPPEPVSWRDDLHAGRHNMVLRYSSGPWQDVTGKTLAWLIAHEMNDTYLLRLILCCPGQGQSPEVFASLRQELPWQPDPSQPECLGQTLFYAGLSSTPALELARAVFDTPALWHTSLTCGEMYCPRTLEGPYLLTYTTPEQERLADTFFGQAALEMGWYVHKGVRQKEEYEKHLYPTAEAREQKLSAALAKAQALHRHLEEGDKDFDTLAAFHQQVGALETAILKYDDLLTTVKDISAVIEINVENYRYVTEQTEFLTESGRDEIFKEQRHRLDRLPRQVESDLGFWQRRLDQARRTLETLRSVAARFPLTSRDPQHLAASIWEHIQANRLLFQPFESDLTIMFDDIKDSMSYIVQHGDQQWRKLMQQHDHLLYPIIIRHHGWVLKNLGDGSLSVFPKAGDAVQAALEIQSELQRHNSLVRPVDQLRVRLGLHTGRALVGATDVLGLAVSLASRVCDTATVGEIVISQATYEQASDAAVDFEPMGPQALKGIAEPIFLYRRPLQE